MLAGAKPMDRIMHPLVHIVISGYRKGKGLAVLMRETTVTDPFSGAVYVFRAKRTDRIKLIFWDDTDVCLYLADILTRIVNGHPNSQIDVGLHRHSQDQGRGLRTPHTIQVFASKDQREMGSQSSRLQRCCPKHDARSEYT
jgi:hypothetical protein